MPLSSSGPSTPTFYSERADWSDVIPIPQYEDENPVAPIFYSEEYKDATDYFRGIVKTGEKSERVLELTEKVIRLNPAHYSAWQYRYETLMALKSPLDMELKLMDELAVKYLKTYQVWHHRRLLISDARNTRDPEEELRFIAGSLRADAKNYHTWSYRQWLLAYLNDEDLWTAELDFVDLMLAQDVRNNSAWHHRFFVVFESGLREGEEDRARVVKRELTYVKQNISLAPNNLSAWNYLRGVLDAAALPYSLLLEFVKPYTLSVEEDQITDLVDLENPPPSKTADLPCVCAVEFLADVCEQDGGKESLLLAIELWNKLGGELDTIRKKYWEYRTREVFSRIPAQ